MEEQQNDKSGQIWLTTFTDMMTNLMLFFLMLYGITRLDADKKGEIMDSLKSKFSKDQVSQTQIKKIVNRFQENMEKENIEKLVRSDELKNETKLEITEKTIKVALNIPVFFDSGDAAIQQAAYNPLIRFGQVLKRMPNKVIVEGHTDNIPIPKGKSGYTSNWELSVARAGAVIDFYIKRLGIPAERFILAGYGEMKPLADNSTPEGRMKNRRIEINILKTQ